SEGGEFDIYASGEFDGPVGIEVVSSTGVVVFRQQISSLEKSKSLQISLNERLATGVYIIRLAGGSSISVQKLVVR
ncbi:MAG: T9SS type A sorting domain-containing protein, partial [Cyclobacteriaceae bacterium]